MVELFRFVHTPTRAFNIDDDRMVDHPIDNGGRGHRVAEVVAKHFKVDVGRHHGGRFAIAGVDDLEEQARPAYHVDDEVALKWYRLEKISEGAITLETEKTGEIDGPTEVGTGAQHPDQIQLSILIEILNDRLGTDFRPGDQLFFDSIRADAVADAGLRQAATVNTIEGFSFAFKKALEDLFIDRMDQNEEITAKFLNETDFNETVSQYLMKEVYIG